MPTTARANLLTLGYARADQPERIDIYPKSFADKDQVKSILANYNAEAKAKKTNRQGYCLFGPCGDADEFNHQHH